jgi:hypothetical protein
MLVFRHKVRFDLNASISVTIPAIAIDNTICGKATFIPTWRIFDMNKFVQLIGGIVFLFASQAQAVAIIGNLPGNDGASTFINAASGGSGGGDGEDSKAGGFTMGSQAFSLDSVDLRLNVANAGSNPLIQIFDSVSGDPTNLLQTLINPTFTLGANSTYTFSAASALTLAANTTYWIVASNAASVADSYSWMASSPSSVPTGAYATNAGYRFSFLPPPPIGASGVLNSYQVNASSVPESATIALLGLGLVGLVLVRRKEKI